MRHALTAVLLGVLLVSCAGKEDGLPADASRHDRLLVPIYFYQGHTVGKASRTTGLQVGDPEGVEWRCVTWPELITNSVSVDTTGRSLYLACGNGVMVSRDGGLHWRLTGGWEMTEVQKVCIDRTDPKRAWAATAYGVFRTDDVTASGKVWRKLEHERLFRFCSDVLQDAVDPGKVWVASEQGLFVSNDSGATFSPSIAGPPVRRVLQDRDAPERTWACTDGEGLMLSGNGGTGFSRVEGPPDVVFCAAQDPRDPGVLYCGTKQGLTVTQDGGETWSGSAEGLPKDFYVYGVAPDPNLPERVVVCGNDGLCESRDGGRTFRRLGFERALIRDVTFARLDTRPDPEAKWRIEPVPENGAPGGDLTPADPAFEKRREAVLAHFRGLPPPPEGRWMGFPCAAQAVAEGREDDALWDGVLRELETPKHSMFFSMPLMGFYLHAKERLPERVARRISSVMTRVPVYRGDTENHWVMHYAALLLAAEAWPETSSGTWYTGRTSKEVHDEAKGWLVHWARLAATRGQGEFDSPNYLFMYVTPMLLLADFAKDPEVRRLGRMMLDLLLADYLSESLRGAYCGGHSRIIGREVELAAANRVTILHYLYAGGIPLPGKVHGWMPFAALSSYRPPEVLSAIANRRDGEWVQTEVKRVRNVLRYGAERNPPVYKYDYMTPRCCLGSLQGGILQPIQQHTWDVTWTGSAENTTLFTVHPSVSARELAMFFPEDIHDITRTITAQKGAYGSPDKLVSASPWEKVFQHENVLLALYSVPPGEQFPHVTLYWPDCLARTEEKGWLFGRDGEFWLACFPCRKGGWTGHEGHSRYRCDAGDAGFVVVTRKGAGTFDAFRRSILAGPAPRLDGKAPVLSYVDPEGRELELAWAGDRRRMDGRPVSFPVDFLYRGPFVNSVLASGVVVLTDGKTDLTLDFNSFTITETAK